MGWKLGSRLRESSSYGTAGRIDKEVKREGMGGARGSVERRDGSRSMQGSVNEKASGSGVCFRSLGVVVKVYPAVYLGL